MKKDKQALFFYMISVTIGATLIALAIMRYIVEINEPKGYLLILLGFVLTINYINYLEKKQAYVKKLYGLEVACIWF